MQDIHTLGGLSGGDGGMVFTSGGVTGVSRRLQPQNHKNQQPLKCPRCDSQNTKFCYYNNYNLSQPRHFCKNCRRYWTKGGVLRSVPVGGGCRKSKRSSKAKTSQAPSNSCTPTDTNNNNKNEDCSNNSYSSSDTSSHTGAAKAAPATTAEIGIPNGSGGCSKTSLINLCDKIASFDHYQPLIEKHQGSSDGQMFAIANDPGLVSCEKMMGPTTHEIMGAGIMDDEVQVDPTAMEQESREGKSGVPTIDWGNVGTGGGDADGIGKTGGGIVGGGGGDEDGLFDFGGVDEGFWNQAQWVDDQSFNFLPQFQVLDFNLEKK